MKINKILKKQREKMGLTQLEVANQAKITVRSYQRIEKGVQDPKTSTSLLIAQALHTTVEEIFPIQEQNTMKSDRPQ